MMTTMRVQWKKMMRGVPALLLCMAMAACISALWTAPAKAGEHRVYDGAGLFTPEETERFESTIAEYRDRMKLDIVVVTTEDAQGKTARDYADDFYVDGNFGYGKLQNGVLFLIDMDNRELYITTGGDAIRLLTDQRIEGMLDDVYVGAQSGDFAASVEAFFRDVDDYYREGIESGQYNYDTETGRISRHRSIRWYEWLLALVVPGFAAGSSCMGVKNRYAMKKERRQADNYLMAYRADCGFAYQDQTDNLVNKFVTTAIIPRGNNRMGGGGTPGGGSSPGRSSTHTSGGGRTLGGGGRKF